MFCKNCGNSVPQGSQVCTNCGTTATSQDNGGFLWGLLGCCVPIAGLILFLVWKDTKPKTSKAAGIGALVSVGLCVLYYIVMLVLGFTVGMIG